MKKYRKRALIEAERFDGSTDMAKKYGIRMMSRVTRAGYLETLEGPLRLRIGDWIATGVNGEHWPIADEIFKETYTKFLGDDDTTKKRVVVEHVLIRYGYADLSYNERVVDAITGLFDLATDYDYDFLEVDE